MTASMTEDTRHGWLLMVTSQIFLWKACTLVSLRGLRIITFLAELNGLDLWATDISIAYLEAFTMERNYIIAGPEFGQLEGHYLIIVKALYGLHTSGLRWHECFVDCLRNEGFSPCKAEPDIWMRLNGNLYEYVAMYVDDLCLGMLDLKSFTDTLQKKYNFKLKGTGPIDFHLSLRMRMGRWRSLQNAMLTR
jgi:hypothetical protein